VSISAGGHGDPQSGRSGSGIVIAVDGPSASGKSSTAQGVARALGLRYLDTGAMYRALTWWLLAHGIDVDDPDAVAQHVADPVIEASTDPDDSWVTVGGRDVSAAIRTREVSGAVSAAARVPQVRVRLIAMQREIIARARAEGRGIVVEGRDIGTVVAPDAVVKVFLTASELARATRRTAELAADPAATVTTTQSEQARRDRMDAGQMARAADAVEIDSTMFALGDVIAMITDLATGPAPTTSSCPASTSSCPEWMTPTLPTRTQPTVPRTPSPASVTTSRICRPPSDRWWRSSGVRMLASPRWSTGSLAAAWRWWRTPRG
jgi:cytidylate kinase